MNPHLSLYRQQQVQHDVHQASPIHLVVMLYDKVISLLRQSLLHLQRKELKEKGSALNRVVEILGELQIVLNHEEGGAVAKNLDALYTFAIQSVTEANLRNEEKPLQSVLGVLEELRKGWRELEQIIMKQNTEESELVSGAKQ